jgi:histidine triad (HIT) family protein
LAKRPLVGRVVGVGFQYSSALLPVGRVLTTDRVIAFYHPKPAWPNHVLIVPKRPIRSLLELGSPANAPFFTDIILAARDAIHLLGLGDSGYTLCANGGPRQEVQQVHFHLFTGRQYANTFAGDLPGETIRDDPEVAVFAHPRPNWETHLLVCPRRRLPPLGDIAASADPTLRRLLAPLPGLNERFHLVRRGYTIFVQESDAAARERLVLHLVAGPQLEG